MSGQIASWKIRIALEEKQLHGYKSIMIIRTDHIDKNDNFWKNNEYGIVRNQSLFFLIRMDLFRYPR